MLRQGVGVRFVREKLLTAHQERPSRHTDHPRRRGSGAGNRRGLGPGAGSRQRGRVEGGFERRLLAERPRAAIARPPGRRVGSDSEAAHRQDHPDPRDAPGRGQRGGGVDERRARRQPVAARLLETVKAHANTGRRCGVVRHDAERDRPRRGVRRVDEATRRRRLQLPATVEELDEKLLAELRHRGVGAHEDEPLRPRRRAAACPGGDAERQTDRAQRAYHGGASGNAHRKPKSGPSSA